MINKILPIQLLIILSGLSFLSCETDTVVDNPCLSEAEIIEFDPLKCGLCWGWIIKTAGNDTIKTRDELEIGIGEQFGYEFEEPVKIFISVGGIVDEPLRDYPYYEINCMERRN